MDDFFLLGVGTVKVQVVYLIWLKVIIPLTQFSGFHVGERSEIQLEKF